jgi:TPR repeat protein
MNIDDIKKKVRTKDPVALYLMGVLLVNGESGVDKNFEEGYKLLEQSAKLGNSDAMYFLGNIHLEEKYNVRNIKTAIGFLDQASKKNHSKSGYKLGMLYFYGKIIKKNLEKAEEYLRKSAISKDNPVIESQFLMGYIYENGLLDSMIDLNEAFRFYRMAADSNHLEAQYKIGKYFIEGIDDDFKKDLGEGINYLRKSSDGGYSKAINMLSSMYISEAKKLLHISARNDIDARYILKSLVKVKTDILY